MYHGNRDPHGYGCAIWIIIAMVLLLGGCGLAILDELLPPY